MIKEHYAYSWSYELNSGFRQTIKNGKVINVIEISLNEAKKLYLATRSKEEQKKGTQLEHDALIELINLDKQA